MRPNIPETVENMMRRKAGREAVLEKCGKDAYAVPETDDGKPRYLISNPTTCKHDCNYLLAALYRARMIEHSPRVNEVARKYARQALKKVLPEIKKLNCQEK